MHGRCPTALNDRERECIEAVCTCLGSQRGGEWRIIDDSLDATHPNAPTPEAIISDGDLTVAVEVKRLLGTEDMAQFESYRLHLKQRLIPRCPGHYVLIPPPDWRLPWERSFIRMIQREIDRVCRTLVVGQKAYLMVPRRGRVHKAASAGSHIWCSHENIALPENSVLGSYYLEDLGPRHRLVTNQAKDRFLGALLAAVQRIEGGEGDVWVDWEDEWPILRLDSEGSTVDVLSMHGLWVEAAARETVRRMIAAAGEKFCHRWADRHAVVLDNCLVFADREEVRDALGELDLRDYPNIHDVYLFGDSLIEPILSRA